MKHIKVVELLAYLKEPWWSRTDFAKNSTMARETFAAHKALVPSSLPQTSMGKEGKFGPSQHVAFK
ncbi:hypothetical protein AC579_7573 [Pseudocercospora musae]|uniref:Uncharacterized protein n=1 Tax=Pseudocercospora musae TaxID=113226 RepID=A0A139I117_9PEZI|nr:hypothetical protein AC579_7573 [Pseudocercospora musae]